jgi:hypothetical protein
MDECADIDDASGYRIGLPLVLLAALALRMHGLQGNSLSSDEIIETSIARLPIQEIIAYPDGFPPLYHLLLAAWTQVFPFPESGRWLSVITGVAAVYAVARWAAQSVSLQAGLFAAVLAAVSPLHVYLSQEMRAYSLYICCSSFALMFFFAALRNDNSKNWFGFVISAALAVNTHYYAALLVALLALVLVFYRPHWAQMRHGLIAFIALGICSAPAIGLLPGDVAYQSEGFAAKAPLLATLGHTAYAFFAGFSLGPSLSELHMLSLPDAAALAAPWVAAFALVGIWLLAYGWQELRRRPFGRSIVFLAVASAPIIGIAGEMAGVGPKVRYWSWILMPLLVWLAAGAARGWRGRGRWPTRIAFAVLVGLQLFAIWNSHVIPKYSIEDIRSTAAYLESHADADDPIFVVADYMAPPLRYYLNGPGTLKNWLPHVDTAASSQYSARESGSSPHKWLVHPRTEQDVRGTAPFDDAAIREWLGAVRSLAADDGRFWLVYSRPFHGDRDGKLLTLLQEGNRVVLDHEFAGVKLYRGQIPHQ